MLLWSAVEHGFIDQEYEGNANVASNLPVIDGNDHVEMLEYGNIKNNKYR